ncbi:glycosyltransferase family 39 protein [Nocardia sp. XZ_19_385]|uniref:ArnT family glycosyltransferase n=1 Tax=Nocardia sp. XZ_19_385 TaxID=2769488 RepID=UPI00189009CA|nr:glycosyltransferase family 39 protein [Nocardia sp. XZ_19_385]
MAEVLEAQERQADTGQPPFAYAGVGAIVAVCAVALFASTGRYGFFGDELYFLSAGRRLAWGYADQGPLVPAIARSMDLLAPGSLVAQRIPAVLVTLAAIVISAQIAREFGGSRTAQVLTATAYVTSPFLLVQGTQLATNTIDTALWVLISWLLIRWVRTRQDQLLFWAAVVTALDMQVKWLIPFFWIVVAVGALVFGPRELLRRKALWLGAAFVLVVSVPMLLWQASHGWPQLGMGTAISHEQDTIGGRYTWIPLAIAMAGLFGGVLLIAGIWGLLRSEALRPFRFLGLVPLLLTVIFVATNGRPYYAAGCYAAIMAAGAVWWTRDARRWRKFATIPLVALSAASVIWSLPWQSEADIDPVDSAAEAGLAIGLYGRFGWNELRDATADAYQELPGTERADAVLIADSYWQASALDVERARYGLPPVYSPNRGFGYFGTPPDAATSVLWIGGDEDELRKLFATVVPVGRSDARLGIPGVTRDVTIWRCDDPLRPWSQTWPGLLRLS